MSYAQFSSLSLQGSLFCEDVWWEEGSGHSTALAGSDPFLEVDDLEPDRFSMGTSRELDEARFENSLQKHSSRLTVK